MIGKTNVSWQLLLAGLLIAVHAPLSTVVENQPILSLIFGFVDLWAVTQLRAPMLPKGEPRTPARMVAELDGYTTPLRTPSYLKQNIQTALVASALGCAWFLFTDPASAPLALVGSTIGNILWLEVWSRWRTWRTRVTVQRLGHVFRVNETSVVLTPELPIHVEQGGRLVVGPIVVEDHPAVLAWIANDLHAHRTPPGDAHHEEGARLRAMAQHVANAKERA